MECKRLAAVTDRLGQPEAASVKPIKEVNKAKVEIARAAKAVKTIYCQAQTTRAGATGPEGCYRQASGCGATTSCFRFKDPAVTKIDKVTAKMRERRFNQHGRPCGGRTALWSPCRQKCKGV